MTFKICKVCLLEKPYSPLGKPGSKASGFRSTVCWDCYKLSKAKRCAAYRATEEGRTKNNAASTKALKKVLATEAGRARYNAASVAWYKQHPETAAANSTKRKTAKLKRLPSWADLNAIKQIYVNAAKQGLVVDHIIPLRGKRVSGLHVANNLQLLTPSENSSKGNRYEV